MADGGRFDLEGLDVRLRVNPRARRISLRIDARTGEVVATAPSARRLGDAVAFARSRRDWLASRLAVRAQAPRLESGDTISVFGAAHVLRPDGRRPRFDAGVLTGCGDGVVDTQLVVRAVRRAALDVFVARTEAHCARLKTPLPTVSLSNARTRWGSCTSAGRGGVTSIRLSWRLALAPFAVADYVVAHECAHLLEGNHGPDFWALVHSLVGEPSPHRAFLRREGPRLHGFGQSSAAAK
jgi:predicted metal-dependent hydrolase